MRKNIFFMLIMVVGILGCPPKPFTTINQKHFNIIVVPDLSNRITNKNYILSDKQLASYFSKLLYPNIIENDANINQKDKLRFDFINLTHAELYKLSSARMDLSIFGDDQMARNKYLGIFSSTSQFRKDTTTFISQFDIYSTVITEENDYGSDIYNYFTNISFLDIDTTTTKIDDPLHKVQISSQFENIIVLFTDGYIEVKSSGNANNKMSNALSESKINDFRTDYLSANKINKITLEDYFKISGYGIDPIINPALSKSRILVLQLFDRGLTFGANRNPGPTDVEIMKLFWTDWLKKSGVSDSNIGIYSCDDTFDKTSTQNIFKTFLNVK